MQALVGASHSGNRWSDHHGRRPPHASHPGGAASPYAASRRPVTENRLLQTSIPFANRSTGQSAITAAVIIVRQRVALGLAGAKRKPVPSSLLFPSGFSLVIDDTHVTRGTQNLPPEDTLDLVHKECSVIMPNTQSAHLCAHPLSGNASITGMVARERYHVRVHALVGEAISGTVGTTNGIWLPIPLTVAPGTNHLLPAVIPFPSRSTGHPPIAPDTMPERAHPKPSRSRRRSCPPTNG